MPKTIQAAAAVATLLVPIGFLGCEEPRQQSEPVHWTSSPSGPLVQSAAPQAREERPATPAPVQPCSQDWLSENPCPLTPEQEREILASIAEDEAAATPASIYALRGRAAELITVESERVADDYWQALVTITNKTPKLIEASIYVDCILFDQAGQRVAISSAVRPDLDIEPGESFTDEALVEVPSGARVTRHECRFRL